MPRKPKINPDEDGVSHINIYSKGKTSLGRRLSNFAKIPIEIDGQTFQSLEGLWFYYATKEGTPRREELKRMSGFPAKQLGQQLIDAGNLNGDMVTGNAEVSSDPSYWSNEFKEIIYKAMSLKIVQHEELKNELKESKLAFEHYYVYDNKAKSAGYKWLTREWEIIRGFLKLDMELKTT